MKSKKKKWAAGMMAFCLAGSLCGSVPLTASAATSVVVSPDNTYAINDGVFQGWGTSLCWWANRVGYSDSLAQQAADIFFGDDGLRLNIMRFNIGGGDNPQHNHITRTDSNMPGYTKLVNGQPVYDWSADANQRNVLMRCIKAAGDDAIVEMFSNSPPYYMCKSGCSTGNTNPGANNLKDDSYTAFAEYLAEVCKHYRDEWGVDIQSVEAMNEPYTNFWGANSPKQEGCHFDLGNSESKIIVELQKSMAARGMSDVIISGTDETSIDTQIDAFNKLSADAKKAVGRIDTHTYGGWKRTELKNTALSAGKNLWMSEVDGNGEAGQNAGAMAPGLWLSQRITTDCNDLNASAWILWQVIDKHVCAAGYLGKKDSGMIDMSKGFWGTAVADHDQDKIVLSKKYYCFGQYTRYIRPGMIMLKSSGSTMAAYDPQNEQLVLVAYNTSSGNSDLSFDLSGFAALGGAAKGIRTSNSENWNDIGTTALSGSRLNVTLPGNSVTTYILDGVKGSLARTNPIDLSKAVLSGSNSWNNNAGTAYDKAFDGNKNTYFDGVGAGWVQADLGQSYDITAIGYCPRSGYEYRASDCQFLISDDGVDWTPIYTVEGEPSFGMHYYNTQGFVSGRYIRYQAPDGAPKNPNNKDNVCCCNIAEIELYGEPHTGPSVRPLTPVSVTGSNAWNNSANDKSKVFDGNQGTYFDGVGDGWVQADLGELYDIAAIAYCPRSGYEYRCADAYFEISKDGTNWTKIHTIDGVPAFTMNYIRDLEGDTEARYVRYAVPSGAPKTSANKDNVYCCNIAEIAIYGSKPNQVPQIIRGDVNADGALNHADAEMMLQYLLTAGSMTDWESGDLNDDGVLTAADLSLLKAMIA